MKRFLVIMLFFAGYFSLLQAANKGEFLISLNGGTSLFSLGSETAKLSFSYGAGLEYNVSLYSSKKFSLGLILGARFGVLSGGESFDHLSTESEGVAYDKSTGVSNDFIFFADINGYSNKVKQLCFYLPVYFQETFRLTRDVSWFIEEGVNVGYTLSERTENTINELVTEGYFPDANVSLRYPLFMGFGKYNNINYSNDRNPNFSMDAHFETGLKFYISGSNNVLYIGVYADYVVYTVGKNTAATELVQYQTQYDVGEPVKFNYSSSLYVGKRSLHPLSFGLNMRFGFNFHRKMLFGNRPLHYLRKL
jgi:hypothetical protein